jgi:hypothetical protein
MYEPLLRDWRRALRLVCLLGIASMLTQCRPKPQAAGTLLAVDETSSPLQDLGHLDRARVFAALCDAAYCGADAGCTVQGRYEQNRQFLQSNFKLDGWQMEFLSARDGEKDVEGYLFFMPDKDDVIIAFRGSETTQPGVAQDWLTTNARMAPSYFAGKKFRGNVHQGFLNAMYGVWHPNETGLIKVLNDHNLWGRRFWVTGYSMGAAIATLVGMRLSDEELTIGGIYTFGGPRLAQWDFQGSFNANLNEVTHHFAHEKDPIPRVSMNLVAVGKTYLFDGQNLRQIDKDGAPDWGLGGLVWGDIRAHLIGKDIPEGYLHSAGRFH